MKILADIKQQTRRHYRQIVAFVAGLLVSALLFIPSEEIVKVSSVDVEMQAESSISIDDAEAKAAKYSGSPSVIRIPKLDIEAEFESPLGINEDGTIEVPATYEKVGWYKYSPIPGRLGPAVILGHVDSFEGPAIFFGLGQLDPGDDIYIDLVNGETAKFKVTKLERNNQDDFPTEKVYGNIDHSGLRLITCTGIYDHKTLRYSHNLIVYGELVE